jgi:hypothetical protein
MKNLKSVKTGKGSPVKNNSATNLTILSKKQANKRNQEMTMKEVTKGFETFMKKEREKEERLIIKYGSLEEWIGSLNKSNGVYFLDLASLEKYSLHYKDNETGKLMTMNIREGILSNDEPDKCLLESLILDLTLFQGAEPIVVWNKEAVSTDLNKLAKAYTEHAKEINALIERFIDMEHVFAEKWYDDSRFDSNTMKAIYKTLFPEGIKASTSYSMYQMFTALHCILFQVSAVKMAA